MQQSINYNMAVAEAQQELRVRPHETGNIRVVIEPSVVGEYTVREDAESETKGTIRVVNMLNGRRSLTFIVKAFVSQEVTFRVLSDIPIALGVFSLNSPATGVLKLQNTAARDLQYSVECENCACFCEERKVEALQCLVAIRRSGRSANGLNSNEREHLESSKEKLLRDIRVCKRKGRRRAQEALERRLANVGAGRSLSRDREATERRQGNRVRRVAGDVERV